MTTEIITSTQSWVCPAGVTSVTVHCYGGGASGQGHATSVQISGNSGGGGGGFSEKVVAVTPSSSYTCTVGVGGAASNGAINDGGDTWFGTSGTVLAKGGSGSTGGAAASGIGDIKRSGGNGADSGTFSDWGGGGGGGAGTNNNGNNGTQGSSGGNGGTGGAVGGGKGGDGGQGSGLDGQNGSDYGAGGGGAGADDGGDVLGGAGGNGVIILVYTAAELPASHQMSQIFHPLPNFNEIEFQQKRRQPIPITFLAQTQDHKRKEFFEFPPHFDYTYHRKKRPEPLSYSPLLFPPQLQRFDPLPEIHYDYQPRKKKIIEISTYSLTHIGNYRVGNNVDGYALYIGTNGPPVFNGSPQAFSQTLPVSYTITPPGEFHVVLRKRNVYGLESQNQYARVIKVDSGGNLLMPPIPIPLNVKVFPLSGGRIRILAKYPSFDIDDYPATIWAFWISASAINPLVDLATHTEAASLSVSYTSSGWSPNTYNVVVGLKRLGDGSISYVTTTVVVPDVPADVQTVYNGYNLTG